MKGALGGIGSFMGKISRFIPGIGFAIDLALNKGVAGQDWTEAIMRALVSSTAGGVSAALGAKIGGGIGAGIGAAALGIGAVPGGVIGAALGALIAGIAGGYVGDQLGANAYEGITGETRTENKPENQAASPIQAPGEQSNNGLEYEPNSSEAIQIPNARDNLKKAIASGSSTYHLMLLILVEVIPRGNWISHLQLKIPHSGRQQIPLLTHTGITLCKNLS
jgi:hypothetical protein